MNGTSSTIMGKNTDRQTTNSKYDNRGTDEPDHAIKHIGNVHDKIIIHITKGNDCFFVVSSSWSINEINT